ncbi:MAG: hypothetical protein JSS81_22185 [Acidobacteria bacterium]|nr:hypothetical protein [Acidobacteriota bacterium]
MRQIITIGLLLLTLLSAAPAFAQEETPLVEDQCEMFGKTDFEGTAVSFEIEAGGLRDVLIYANPFGCNITIDEKTENKSFTVKAENVPWNMALQSILESNELAVEVEESGFRIVNAPSRFCKFSIKKEKPAEESLYTEFVRLNYLTVSDFSFSYLKLLKKQLSDRGEVEFADRDQTVIVTDIRGRVDKARAFIETVDLMGEPAASKEEKLVTELVKLKNVPDRPRLVRVFDPQTSSYRVEQDISFRKLIDSVKAYLSPKGSIEFDRRSETLFITDTPSNVEFMKGVVVTYDYEEIYAAEGDDRNFNCGFAGCGF